MKTLFFSVCFSISTSFTISNNIDIVETVNTTNEAKPQGGCHRTLYNEDGSVSTTISLECDCTNKDCAKKLDNLVDWLFGV